MIIIRDTQEKIGYWSFGDIEIKEQHLKTGDYTILGKEELVCIERKKTVSEIAINIGSDSVRFNKELERMSKFPLAYIICEFSIEDVLSFPKGSNLPNSVRAKLRIGGKFIMKTLTSYKEKYGIEVIFAGNRENAIEQTLEIFKHVQN